MSHADRISCALGGCDLGGYLSLKSGRSTVRSCPWPPPIGMADSLRHLRFACSGDVFVSIL